MRGRDYLTSETAARHRKYLRSNGWVRTTKSVFGISQEMWINHISKIATPLDQAILSQQRRDKRLRMGQARGSRLRAGT